MPVPSSRLKELIEGTVDHHASQRWPALEEVTITWRGSYGYLTGYLSDNDDDTIKLSRIQYLGDPEEPRRRFGLRDSLSRLAGSVSGTRAAPAPAWPFRISGPGNTGLY